MNTTRQLAEFIASTPAAAISGEAREQARRAILDTLGVTLAGCREHASRIVAEMAREQGGACEATVFGHRFRTPATEAALVNGTSGHALDFDDVSMSMRGHPSVPVVPAVIALGEKLGSSGREVSEAFVLGFEIECKVGRLIGAPHYALGWHPTSTFGTLGATAASARLLQLDADRTQAAIGIGASLASGARRNFGSMTKPLHAGWAARNGVVAAGLAARGFTADAMTLEAEDGWLHAASGGAQFDPSAIGRLGDPWEILSPGIGVKLYPCCYFTHLSIDASLSIAPAINGHSASVERVDVSVSPGTTMVLRKTLPASGLEGKFSLEYCVAAALGDGAVTLGTFTDEAIVRPDARQLMKLVRVSEDGPPASDPMGGSAQVTVRFRDREPVQSECAEIPRGDPRNPLSWEQLSAKFRDCAIPAMPDERIDRVIRMIDTLDELEDIRDLIRAMDAERSWLTHDA